MRTGRTIRMGPACSAVLGCAIACAAQSQSGAPEQVVIDKVVAVVNNRAILESDVENELHVSVLEPRNNGEVSTRPGALTRLISRTLIQQQIRREEEQAAVPTEEQVQARVKELREQLPVCVRANCATDAGWGAFLAANGLTEGQVENYMRLRVEILNFIENRFRQGIRIPQEDVEKYYKETLLPQYPAGQPAPTLESVAPRIQEVLLQQQVTNMFSAWLDNLRKQGDVEVLDPRLETPASEQGAGGGDR